MSGVGKGKREHTQTSLGSDIAHARVCMLANRFIRSVFVIKAVRIEEEGFTSQIGATKREDRKHHMHCSLCHDIAMFIHQVFSTASVLDCNRCTTYVQRIVPFSGAKDFSSNYVSSRVQIANAGVAQIKRE